MNRIIRGEIGMMDGKPELDTDIIVHLELEDRSCYLCKHFAICRSDPYLIFKIQCLKEEHSKWEEALKDAF